MCSWALFSTNAFGKDAQQKEWVFLVFLNGHNNLDRFGSMNIKQMEQIGSTKDIDIVVQWASLANKKTKRLHIEKSTNQFEITSPVVEELPQVDMGDYKNLVEFVKWASEKYPAKKYFINVWNHGNGWRFMKKKDAIGINDISYDDVSGNYITTEQLAIAMKDISTLLGTKIELYGSDACLMAMAEIGAQMADSVKFFAGSQEVEPGEGWPYANFLERWSGNPNIDGGELGTILAEEFLKAYSGGVYGTREVTFSNIDLQKMNTLYKAFFDLSEALVRVNKNSFTNLRLIARETQAFYNSDYKDARDFIDLIQKSEKLIVEKEVLDNARKAIEDVVVSNQVSPSFKRASGIAIWLPIDFSYWNQYGARYNKMVFQKETKWGDFLSLLNSN